MSHDKQNSCPFYLIYSFIHAHLLHFRRVLNVFYGVIVTRYRSVSCDAPRVFFVLNIYSAFVALFAVSDADINVCVCSLLPLSTCKSMPFRQHQHRPARRKKQICNILNGVDARTYKHSFLDSHNSQWQKEATEKHATRNSGWVWVCLCLCVRARADHHFSQHFIKNWRNAWFSTFHVIAHHRYIKFIILLFALPMKKKAFYDHRYECDSNYNTCLARLTISATSTLTYAPWE